MTKDNITVIIQYRISTGSPAYRKRRTIATKKNYYQNKTHIFTNPIQIKPNNDQYDLLIIVQSFSLPN